MAKINLLAYYLPQFHPIPENDLFWGKGFTEWTNVSKAKPMFQNHYQPKLPSELGFYDLRLPEVQKQQSDLALEYGVDGFIYYQYYFGDGKLVLEKPAEQMLKEDTIKIPFCFCWANETWKGVWHGLDNPDILIEQKYLGEKDYTNYFNYLLPFFKDNRYIKIENKPMFHIYRLADIPNWENFLTLFDTLAIQNGFDGIHFIATLGPISVCDNQLVKGKVGIDVFDRMRHKSEFKFSHKRWTGKLERKIKKLLKITNEIGIRKKPLIFDYQKSVETFNLNFPNEKYIPCVFPNWDNSPRSGKKSLIFKNATPTTWQIHLEKTFTKLQSQQNNPQTIVIKSWNEWAEGNYLEPDYKFGRAWLEVIKIVKQKFI